MRAPPRRLASAALVAGLLAAAAPAVALQYQLREGRNLNAFLQEGPTAAHLLLTDGPSPRILAAFPAGNSGVAVWFERTAGPIAWTLRAAPRPVTARDPAGRPLNGFVAEAETDAAVLTIDHAALSSVRVLRDAQQGIPPPAGIACDPVIAGDTITWRRDRLDGHAGYLLALQVLDGAVANGAIRAGQDGHIRLRITAATGETPLTEFPADGLLSRPPAPASPPAADALRFLSYREKFLAGSWRFDTYFGRDTLMSVRLLMPALTPEAVESGLGSVLDRLSPTGEVAHEEDIGESAVLAHLKAGGERSDAPIYDYKMIDSSFLLAPVAGAWLLDDPRAAARAAAFLARREGGVAGAAVHGRALVTNLRLVLQEARPFAAAPGVDRLISLKAGFTVGDWRDSGDGLGGGRYPYDVDAILVPAALRAIDRMYRAGILEPYLNPDDRALFASAGEMAEVWARRAPGLFALDPSPAAASAAVAAYARASGVPAAPALDAARSGLPFFALSLDARGRPIAVMNSDLGFSLLFDDRQDPEAMVRHVRALMAPFPAGLMTGAGMVVANAAYADPALQSRFSRNAYHGAVIWSWQQALFADGLAHQLARHDLTGPQRDELRAAQARLWTAIEATRALNSSELWSWSWDDPSGWRAVPFGASGGDVDESNAAQLWSTVYLAIHAPGAAR